MLHQGCFASGGLRCQSLPDQRLTWSSYNTVLTRRITTLWKSEGTHATRVLGPAAAAARAAVATAVPTAAAPAALQRQPRHACKHKPTNSSRIVAAYAAKEATGGLATAVSSTNVHTSPDLLRISCFLHAKCVCGAASMYQTASYQLSWSLACQ